MIRPARLALLAALLPPFAVAQTFTDASDRLPPGARGGSYGAAIVDVDADGRTDLVGPRRALLRTAVGFREIAPFDVEFPLGNVFGDVDADGRLEAYVLDAFEPGIYAYAPARETFARTPTSFEVGEEGGGDAFLVQGSLLLDADGDGALDAFIGNDGGFDLLYRGTGTGAFADAHDLVPDVFAFDYGAHAADYDRDGDTDIAIGVCPGGFANLLYRNDGADGFAEVAAAAGVADERAAWGVVWVDVDNDGWLDLYTANMPSGPQTGANALYRNNRDGTFTDVAAAAGVTGGADDNTWTVLAADVDNDGWTDLVAINDPEPSRLFLNDGDGTFTEAAGAVAAATGQAAAVGDVDDDGWPDLYVSRWVEQGGDALLLNDGGANNWLRVRLRSTASAPDGVGARVEVEAGGRTVVREVSAGDGMMGQSHGLHAHVGLGAAALARVTVRWPSGTVDTVDGVAPNQTLTLVEGVGADAPPEPFALLSPADGAPVDPAAPVTLAWEPAGDDVSYTVVLSSPTSDVTYAADGPSLTLPAGTLATGEHRWTVEARDGYSMRAALRPRAFGAGTVDAEAPPAGALALTVGPNPSRGRATVRFELPQPGDVALEVVDVLGRRVWRARLGALAPGPHAVAVPAEAVGPGAYVVRLTSPSGAAAARLTRVP